VGLLGYCVGGTLSGIYAAQNPDNVAALVNLAGPFDFSKAGLLGKMVDPRFFNPAAVAEAGNVSPGQMQSGFVMLRPTLQISKWVTFADRALDPAFRESFDAMEAWANDNIPFPAAAYVTYITELYQQNKLFQGQHRVSGKPVDLGAIDCPVLSVVASKDNICPPEAATALNDLCGSKDKDVLTIPGGHVGAVVGSKAPTTLYPALSTWLRSKLCN
jgi:polyhydroxyalkanoate synthase